MQASMKPPCERCKGTRIEPQSVPPAPCLECSERHTTFRAPAVTVEARVTGTTNARNGVTKL